MGKIAKYSRRAFLIGSAAVAGGVAFGTYQVMKPLPNPLLDDLADGETSFNAFVTVSPDGVKLITPHADVGQGVAAMQALLIAEEMDLDTGQFTTGFGPPSPAYYNTALATDAAPFLSTDDSFVARAGRAAMKGVFKVMGMQVTGGSSAVPDSYIKLRVAGAVARETLKEAAARRSGTSRADLTTAGGAVILPDGSRIAYTDLAAEAAGIAPVEEVILRDPSQWRLIGRPTARMDMIAKSTGALKFGMDHRVEGMVHAAIRLSPRRGMMNGFNADAAEAVPGVQKVLPVTNGVAVIAGDSWTAMQGANALRIDWGPAPYPAEQAGHWDAVAESFSEKNLDKEWRAEGDLDALPEGAEIIEAEYRAPYVAHQPMEPLNAIARVTDDGVEIWSGHQMPRFVQSVAAGITGHDADQVVFHNQWSGGSFGHRLEFEQIRYAVEIANQMRGIAVKLTFTREEDFAQDFPRQIGMARSRGAVADGKVIAADFQVATTSASRSQFSRIGMSSPGADGQIVAGLWNTSYAIPNLRVRGYAVTGLAPTSSWRSVGASTAGFFNEAFMDELIQAAGLDPMQARIAMCNVDHHRKTLEAVAEMCDWAGPLGNGRGRGVAMIESFGVPCAEVVEVTATDAGIRIDKVWVAADVGRVIDPVNFENQVQGGVVWGLGHAMNCEITFADGMAQQSNFHDHDGMRMWQCPQIEVRGLENNPHVRGVGEPPVPPAAPALANAIFAATGQRLREMPFAKFVEFA